ncbi:TetR/AcrR family transcriptional regulator [Bacillus sp. SW14]|uniref:TetR/AcrR family transcriptional regulator n=1 Tax=Bacillus sp. SW14 TaxID=3391618 RepID=UPI0039E51979
MRQHRTNDLQATSMAMISSESGVSMGSIYNSFSGKEDIVNELFTSIVEFQTEIVLKDFYNNSSILERFERIWRNLIQFTLDYPDAFQFIEQYSFSPYIYDSSKKEPARTLGVLPCLRYMQKPFKNSCLYQETHGLWRKCTGGLSST